MNGLWPEVEEFRFEKEEIQVEKGGLGSDKPKHSGGLSVWLPEMRYGSDECGCGVSDQGPEGASDHWSRGSGFQGSWRVISGCNRLRSGSGMISVGCVSTVPVADGHIGHVSA